jgi:hypothetical protein
VRLGNGRLMMTLGSLVRLVAGTGYLTNPDAMSRARLAPDVRDHPAGRMSLRGFGGLHMSVALATLFSAATGRSCRELVGLNLGCAVADTATTLLEWRNRGGPDEVVLGSVPVDVVDTVWWAVALRHV